MSFAARSDVCRLRWDRERIFFRNEHKVKYVNGVVFSTHPTTHMNRLLRRWVGKNFFLPFFTIIENLFLEKAQKTVNEANMEKSEENNGMSVNVHKFLFPLLLLFVLFLFVYRIRRKRSCGREQWKRFIFTNRYIPSGLERSVGEQRRKLACLRRRKLSSSSARWIKVWFGIILLLLYRLSQNFYKLSGCLVI